MEYLVTGIDKRGKRFALSFNNLLYVMSINLWKGSVWKIKNGKRILIKRFINY